MKPERAESLLVENLFLSSRKKKKIPDEKIKFINKLSGDASTRRYYRLETNSTSYVVCLDNPSKEENEKYPFYSVHQFLQKNLIRVPHILDLDLSNGYLLEEDLGDQTLLNHLGQTTTLQEEYDIYKKCLDILITLQSKASGYKKYDFSKLAFDNEKYMYEFEFTIDYFIKRQLKAKVKKKEKLFLLSSFAKISEELSSYPMVSTHRDFHSRNVMVKDDEYILIDFQDARLGIPQYDLVSLLDDCYYALDPKNKDRLVKYYWENSQIDGQKDFKTFLRLYDLMKIQRVFKAIGSFSYIFHHRRDKRYLRHIGHAMEMLKSTMQKHPDLNELKQLLFKIYYEN